MQKLTRKLGVGLVTAAATLALTMSAAAAWGATAELTDGEVGGYTQPDTKTVQDKSVNIKKDIIAFNANASTVYAPVVTFDYTVVPATITDQTITDETTDHASGTAVTAPVKAGITTGLTVNGGSAGTASSATGSLAFTNSDTFTTSASGATNTYDLTFNFANVTFPSAGVYRYQITESLANSATYDSVAMVDAAQDVRFLDVYVDGEGNIYGYVCIASNTSITPSSTKTNGFVDASNGADKYYTYDLTLSKDVENDTFGTGHAFPYTVIFSNGSATGTFKITETAGTGSTGISPAAGTATWSGVAKVKEGGDITYTGIPCGASVAIYETNDMDGTTYTVSTKVNNGTAVVDNNVDWHAAPSSAAAQTTRASYESSVQTITTTIGTAVAATQTYAVTNTLLLISPTGIVLRYGPFAAMLLGGIVLLFVATRRRKETDNA